MKTVPAFVAAIALIGLTGPALALAQGKPPQAKAAANQAAGSGAVVKVDGLVCDFCVHALNRIFKKQASVKAVTVDLDAKELRLAFKPGATLDDATIGRLVRDAGYNVVSISRQTT